MRDRRQQRGGLGQKGRGQTHSDPARNGKRGRKAGDLGSSLGIQNQSSHYETKKKTRKNFNRLECGLWLTLVASRTLWLTLVTLFVDGEMKKRQEVHEVHIVLLGRLGVGKSTFTIRTVCGRFCDEYGKGAYSLFPSRLFSLSIYKTPRLKTRTASRSPCPTIGPV
jgi:hypothetical protein